MPVFACALSMSPAATSTRWRAQVRSAARVRKPHGAPEERGEATRGDLRLGVVRDVPDVCAVRLKRRARGEECVERPELLRQDPFRLGIVHAPDGRRVCKRGREPLRGARLRDDERDRLVRLGRHGQRHRLPGPDVARPERSGDGDPRDPE